MLRRLVIAIPVIILVIAIYHPLRHAQHYPYIRDEDVLEELVPIEYIPDETNLKQCFYEDIVLNNVEIDIADVTVPQKFHRPSPGGEYIPTDCAAMYRTAVIIPYRNRPEQLRIFLNYMHGFLQKQYLHYKIFVAEQNNSRPFNRAKMFNYGAVEAIRQKFDCLVLQDVDLLPITTGNIFACAKKPRHMSASVDTLRFNLPYLTLFGGAVAIQTSQYKKVNGMSNIYNGWGGEDDDFYSRLQAFKLYPYRFSPALSKYTMLRHKKEKPSEDRHANLKSALERQSVDGLNTLNMNYAVKLEPLFTRILAT